MSHIIVQFAADKKLAPAKKLLCHWAEQALAGRAENHDVTIRIVDIAEMSTLNETYRRKSGPTNVLSFPADLPEVPAEACLLLGDIVVCADVVNREAVEQGKTSQSHWAHMIVHGIFHLLGYDHEKDDEAIVMEALEIDVLNELGFANPYNDGDIIKHHE
jgi:probable rRNA maturation factor